MRILVYGAGNIGCLYAALLERSGQEVSILARGAKAAKLRDRGIQLVDARDETASSTLVQVVESLGPGDAYDLVLVILPRQRVAEVLPILGASQRTPGVMFMGNNAAGPEELTAALGPERVLLGFPGAAGYPDGDRIRYLICSAREQPTTIGELDGSRSPRIVAAAAALEQAGFPVAICSDMDAWLKTHAAEMSPTVSALFMAAGDRLRMARTRDSLVLMVRSIREGYRALGRLGVPIKPASHRIFEWLPEPLLVAMMRRMVASEEMAVKIGHAEAARDEWRAIDDDLRALIGETGFATPALDRLRGYLDAAAPPIADGSDEIRLRWLATRR